MSTSDRALATALLAASFLLATPAAAKEPTKAAPPKLAGRFSLDKIRLPKRGAVPDKEALSPRRTKGRPVLMTSAELDGVASHVAHLLGARGAKVDPSHAFNVSIGQSSSQAAPGFLLFRNSSAQTPDALVMTKDSSVMVAFDTAAGYFYLLECLFVGEPKGFDYDYVANFYAADRSPQSALTGQAPPQHGRVIIPLQPDGAGSARVTIRLHDAPKKGEYFFDGCRVTPTHLE